MSKFRSFLAIELADNLKSEITKVEDDFKIINPNLKFVPPENMHFTLKFFGDINEDLSNKIAIKVEKVLKNYKPFNINLESCGAFPNKNYIKVIWIGISDNNTLNSLQKELDLEFHNLGFKKEKNHTSHLTIARVRSPKSKEKIKDKIESFENKTFGKMEVNKIILKKSTLTKEGPIYEDLKIFKVI